MSLIFRGHHTSTHYLLHVTPKVIPVPTNVCLGWFKQVGPRVVLSVQSASPSPSIDGGTSAESFPPYHIESPNLSDWTMFGHSPMHDLVLVSDPCPVQRTIESLGVGVDIVHLGVIPVVTSCFNQQDGERRVLRKPSSDCGSR